MTTIGQARTSSDADLAVQYASSGWIEDAESRTWSYSSADAPSYVFSVNADMTGIISTNMKLRFKQSAGTYKYAGVTAVGAYSGGVTLITVYGGTDYDLDNEAVTNVAYSAMRAPFGFPMNPSKWTVEVIDTTQRTQLTPTISVWYNVGTTNQQISLPTGVWIVSYSAQGTAQSSTAQVAILITLSTQNNSESNTHLTSVFESSNTFAAWTSALAATFYREEVISITSETIYYLNIEIVSPSVTALAIGGSIPTIIRAVWAGL